MLLTTNEWSYYFISLLYSYYYYYYYSVCLDINNINNDVRRSDTDTDTDIDIVRFNSYKIDVWINESIQHLLSSMISHVMVLFNTNWLYCETAFTHYVIHVHLDDLVTTTQWSNTFNGLL